jgi:mannosyltransferase
MCSFFATEIFSQPRLKDLTYYMRMDTDSLFTEPLCYDPFEVIHVRKRIYGYLSTGPDPQEATEGMWPFVQHYAETHPSVQEQLRKNNWEWSHRDERGRESRGFIGYDTNFEIVKLEAFRRPEVKEWLDAIANHPEGIFKWRWGKPYFNQQSDSMLFITMASRGRAAAICHRPDVLRCQQCY